MKQRHVQWLYGELPSLVKAGVLSTEDEQRLREHYGPVKRISAAATAVILFGVLGAMLVGSGIMLLLAHNWETLGRPARAALSFLPLVGGQALVGWTLYRKQRSAAWREGSGAFLALAIGASIALIGQTYHIPGNAANFLLTWVLLGLPLVYLLRSSMAAVLYLIGVTVWTAAAQDAYGQAIGYWPLLGGIVPFAWSQYRGNRHAPGTAFVAWALCLSLSIGLGVAMEKVLPGLWIVNYAGLFAIFYLAGRSLYRDVAGQPLAIAGSFGTVGLAAMLTYDDWWRRIGMHHYRGNSTRYLEWFGAQDYVLSLVLLAGVVLFAVWYARRKDYPVMLWVTAPALAVIGFAIASAEGMEDVPPLLFNGYLLALGVLVLRQGIHEGRMVLANGGMGILALLFTLRFFDSDMGILVRGIAFILIGAGFLGANLWLSRKLKARVEEVQS